MQRTKQTDIDARNKLNAMADCFEPALISALASLAERKVWKVSGYGGLTVAAKKVVDDLAASFGLTHEFGWRLVITSPVTSLTAELTYRYETGETGCAYATEAFRIGRRDDSGILTEPEAEVTYPAGRPQFTVHEVETALARAFELETQARDLRRSVSCFTR